MERETLKSLFSELPHDIIISIIHIDKRRKQGESRKKFDELIKHLNKITSTRWISPTIRECFDDNKDGLSISQIWCLADINSYCEPDRIGESVTMNGNTYSIAPENYMAKTGKVNKAWRKAGSDGRYILRNGSPIFKYDSKEIPRYHKATSIYEKNNKLYYKNDSGKKGWGEKEINWEDGSWHIGEGQVW